MTDHLTENARLRAALEALVTIVEGIDGAMNHGTWRDDKGMRLKDTPQWVALYVALATPAPDAAQEAARVLLRELFPQDEKWGEFTRGDALKACQDHHISPRQFQSTLRALAGDRT